MVLHPETLPLAQAFQTAGVKTWLIGGNAVELLCGGNLRPHDDIDFIVLESHALQAIQVLQELGFSHAHGSLEAGDVFYRRGDLVIDLVPVNENPPRTLGELASISWPENFLTEHFVELNGVSIRTLTPAMHREMKSIVAAYYDVDLREKDKLDLAALKNLP